jgi:hypothetical protein
MAQIRNKQVLYDSLIQFQSALQIKGGAAGTASDDFVIKSQLDAIEALVNSIEWQDSVLDADILTPPGSPTTGDRYLINGTGAGGWAGKDNQIAEWDGTAWQYTLPTTGMFVSADDEDTLLYYYGGASWSTKSFEATTASTGLVKSTFDIQLADAASNNGISVTSGAISAEAADGTITVTAGGIAVGTITSAKVSDFTSASETAIFTAANFVDGTTIDFTVTAGDSVTAEVADDSLLESKLDATNAPTDGHILTYDNASGGFTWIDPATIEAQSAARTENAALVTTTDEDDAVSNIFGGSAPHSSSIPQIFVNGQLMEVRGDKTGDCYFAAAGTPGTAIAFASLTGAEDLQWRGSAAGFELDASDRVICQFEV